MRIAIILVTVLGMVSPALAGDDASSQPTMRRPSRRSLPDPVVYARVGYGAAFGDSFRPGPAIGLGIRGETEPVVLDVSVSVVVNSTSHDGQGTTLAGSIVRLAVLNFLDGNADGGMYVGGGFSWGGVLLDRRSTPTTYTTAWTGSGLQGDVTVGYEITRKSPLRMFVQADVGIPFFTARSETYARSDGGIIDHSSRRIEKQYTPSAVVAMGIGWKRR